MGADEGWACLRDAAVASLRSRRRLLLGVAIAVAAAVLPALAVAATAIRPYPAGTLEGFRLPPTRIGLIELPFLHAPFFEETFFDAATDAGLRALLVVLGALVVNQGPSEARSSVGRSPANPVPVAGWIVVEVVVGGLAIAVVAGLVGGAAGRWLRALLSLLWIGATVLVLPGLVLGGRSLAAAVRGSVRSWRQAPLTMGVAVGGLALVAQGGSALLDTVLLQPVGLLFDVPLGAHFVETIVMYNLVLAAPLAVYAATWWTLQAELWADLGGPSDLRRSG